LTVGGESGLITARQLPYNTRSDATATVRISRHRSTETALLKVLSDVYATIDRQQVTLLGLLDLSAAFDCVDHDILLCRLRHKFGICGTALEWIASFLFGRSQQVYYKGRLPVKLQMLFRVPQGSVIPDVRHSA